MRFMRASVVGLWFLSACSDSAVGGDGGAIDLSTDAEISVDAALDAHIALDGNLSGDMNPSDMNASGDMSLAVDMNSSGSCVPNGLGAATPSPACCVPGCAVGDVCCSEAVNNGGNHSYEWQCVSSSNGMCTYHP